MVCQHCIRNVNEQSLTPSSGLFPDFLATGQASSSETQQNQDFSPIPASFLNTENVGLIHICLGLGLAKRPFPFSGLCPYTHDLFFASAEQQS